MVYSVRINKTKKHKRFHFVQNRHRKPTFLHISLTYRLLCVTLLGFTPIVNKDFSKKH